MLPQHRDMRPQMQENLDRLKHQLKGSHGHRRGTGDVGRLDHRVRPPALRDRHGKEHDSFVVGLSPRKASLTFYGLMYYGSNDDLLERLGPHRTGKGCLYVKRLTDTSQEARATCP